MVRHLAGREIHRPDFPLLTMAGPATPSEIVKGLLQGIAPPRPLFLPIVFSHAARLENLSLRSFLSNPTKISNSLRLIRGRLRADGIICYFDPFLEAQTLGATIEWSADGQSPSLRWPDGIAKGEWPEVPASSGARVKNSPVALAIDVVRRLKAIVRDDCLLTASVTGPFTLAALLMGNDPAVLSATAVPAEALDVAAATISEIAKALAEAGVGAIFIREDFLPALSPEDFEAWTSRLAPTMNIVRFYQALPVLLLGGTGAFAANRDAIASHPWDCVVCPLLDEIMAGNAAMAPSSNPYSELASARLGLALPAGAFDVGQSGAAEFDERVRRIVSELRPAIITTAGDVPAAADVEHLNKLWEDVRRA
ncbi:MAG: uroporphyrinogen decarboxylase family protein [Candidatus Acidiferrales bacterium]